MLDRTCQLVDVTNTSLRVSITFETCRRIIVGIVFLLLKQPSRNL
jgi:hypothetical protein